MNASSAIARFYDCTARDGEYSRYVPGVAKVEKSGEQLRITLGDGKTIDLSLPAGLEDGTQMRLAGKGEGVHSLMMSATPIVFNNCRMRRGSVRRSAISRSTMRSRPPSSAGIGIRLMSARLIESAIIPKDSIGFPSRWIGHACPWVKLEQTLYPSLETV